jgi:DNA-directed RNA polymerase subunit RPC12/RpoP
MMSEFKYACPVCGQHIKCDSSQAGTVMDCPTCFQKITVPQAPEGEDQKFILTGSKVVDKMPARAADTPAAAASAHRFPGVLVVALILVFMGTVAAAIYWVTIIHPRQTAGPAQGTNAVAAGAKPKSAKPVLVAPPANDSNWMLVLDTNTLPAIPEAPLAGRIHGQDFIVERAAFQNGSLTFRWGRGGNELSAAISFGPVPPEELSGKTINVTTNAEKAARVTLHWKDENGGQKAAFDAGYVLRLEFGPLAKDRLRGKIYLCLPDAEKSYLAGAFNADARKPKPKSPAKK